MKTNLIKIAAVTVVALVAAIIYFKPPRKEWRELKCGLWVNTKGDIGLRISNVIYIDENGKIETEEFYLTNFGFNENQYLKDVIDTATFKELGNSYYKDKNHIYQFSSMCDSGNLYIFDADYASFEVLGDCYARDKNNIFEMHQGKLKNVDYKTFKTFKGAAPYAKDKNGYYSSGYEISIDSFLRDNEVENIFKKLDAML